MSIQLRLLSNCSLPSKPAVAEDRRTVAIEGMKMSITTTVGLLWLTLAEHNYIGKFTLCYTVIGISFLAGKAQGERNAKTVGRTE